MHATSRSAVASHILCVHYYIRLQISFLSTVWHKIFAGSNFCDSCDFSNDPQKLINANIFPAKFYSRVCSTTTCLLRLETKRLKWRTKLMSLVLHRVRTLKYCLKICNYLLFHCTYSLKTMMTCPRTSQKINPSKKNQSHWLNRKN